MPYWQYYLIFWWWIEMELSIERSDCYEVVEKIIHLEQPQISYVERLLDSLQRAKRITVTEHEALLALAWSLIVNSNF